MGVVVQTRIVARPTIMRRIVGLLPAARFSHLLALSLDNCRGKAVEALLVCRAEPAIVALLLGELTLGLATPGSLGMVAVVSLTMLPNTDRRGGCGSRMLRDGTDRRQNAARDDQSE
jgi:hypothetical protein